MAIGENKSPIFLQDEVDIFWFWWYKYRQEELMEKEQDILVIKQFINQVIPYKKENTILI